MTSNPSLLNISRFAGCTLTGALSVTTQIRDAVTVIHGPKGCTHHNFSLLHATGLENDCFTLPDLISTSLTESDIIYGGEDTLDRTLEAVAKMPVSTIFVLSTCIVDTIGDDVAAVCRKDRAIQVIPIPTAGFLGGTFQDGVNNALNAIAETSRPCKKVRSVNIIGEKNLEYEVDENFDEVLRLLTLLKIPVNLRFLHNCTMSDIVHLGAAQLNILRDDDLKPVGEYLEKQFKTPYVPSYPVGLEGTIYFLEAVAGIFGMPCSAAVLAEKALQEEVLGAFEDIRGSSITFDPCLVPSGSFTIASDVADRIDITIDRSGCRVPLELSPPVGTTGILRMLHRWRRAIHA
jgi:nitrogenase molybdenum-iron protein alpha/beta subunit